MGSIQPNTDRDKCAGLEPRVTLSELLAERRKRSKGGGGRGRREYLVRWLGWGPQYDSWEDERNVHDPRLVADLRAERVLRSALLLPTESKVALICSAAL